MKRFVSLMLALLLALVALPLLASATDAVVYLDGKKTNFTGYNINGSTYYKLRDVCQALNIGVYYDHSDKSHYIQLQTDADYGKENPDAFI